MLILLMVIAGPCQLVYAFGHVPAPTAGIDRGQNSDVPIQATDTANNPPVIVSTPPTQAIVYEKYTYPLEVYDKDKDQLSFRLTLSPLGMKVQAMFGVIEWTPLPGQVGINRVIVAVSDPTDTVKQDFNITVLTAGTPYNTPPVIISTPVTTAQVGVVYNYHVLANDTEGDVLTFHLNMYPPGMKINAQTGLIYWVPSDSDEWRPKSVITVSDGYGNGTQWFYLGMTVPNHSPIIISQPKTSAEVGSKYRYKIQASDPDSNDTITFGFRSGPYGMTVNNTTGEVNWIPSASEKGKTTVIVMATDGKAETLQTYTVVVTEKAQSLSVLMVGLSLVIVIVLVSLVMSVFLLRRRKLKLIAEEKLALEARNVPPPPPWMTADEEHIIRTAPDKTISSTVKDVLDETIKDLSQVTSRPAPGQTMTASPKVGQRGVPMREDVVAEPTRPTITMKRPEPPQRRAPPVPRPPVTYAPSPPITKRPEPEVQMAPKKVKTQAGPIPSQASSADDLIDRILNKTKTERTKEQGTEGPSIPKAKAKAITKGGKDASSDGGPAVAPQSNTVQGPSESKVLIGLNRLTKALPAELWGKKKEELAKAIAGGTYARGDNDKIIVRLGKRWYHGNPEDPSTYMSRYTGKTE